jgi:Prolyl oligopeptidase family
MKDYDCEDVPRDAQRDGSKDLKLMDQPIESFDIDFEGAKLPAYFIAGGEGKRPTLIALGGFDSTMEEVYGWIGTVAAQYGWHCLIFEGPGQWTALKTNPGLLFRPDYEKPVSAVVDYLFSRPDVDQDKVALIGYSFGGYLAPRAAAGEGNAFSFRAHQDLTKHKG